MSVARIGVVVSGEYSGWNVSVADDRDGDTGGYFLYFNNNGKRGFDLWFEHENGLLAELADFEVHWIE